MKITEIRPYVVRMQCGVPLRAQHERIESPQKPGLGIDLDEDYLAGHLLQVVRPGPGLYYKDGGVPG